MQRACAYPMSSTAREQSLEVRLYLCHGLRGKERQAISSEAKLSHVGYQRSPAAGHLWAPLMRMNNTSGLSNSPQSEGVTCRGSSTPPKDRRADLLTSTDDDALRAFAAQVAITPAVTNVTDNRRRTCAPRSGDIGSSCGGSCLTPAMRTPKHDFALSDRLPIRWDDLRCSFPSLRSAIENLSRSEGDLSLFGVQDRDENKLSDLASPATACCCC